MLHVAVALVIVVSAKAKLGNRKARIDKSLHTHTQHTIVGNRTTVSCYAPCIKPKLLNNTPAVVLVVAVPTQQLGSPLRRPRRSPPRGPGDCTGQGHCSFEARTMNMHLICMHAYIYIYIYILTYRCLQPNRLEYLCLQDYLHLSTHTYVYIGIHTYMHTYIHTYIHTYMHTRNYTQTDMYTYKLTDIFLHRHTSRYLPSLQSGKNTRYAHTHTHG